MRNKGNKNASSAPVSEYTNFDRASKFRLLKIGIEMHFYCLKNRCNAINIRLLKMPMFIPLSNVQISIC